MPHHREWEGEDGCGSQMGQSPIAKRRDDMLSIEKCAVVKKDYIGDRGHFQHSLSLNSNRWPSTSLKSSFNLALSLSRSPTRVHTFMSPR